MCCSPWDRNQTKRSDWTRVKKNELLLSVKPTDSWKEFNIAVSKPVKFQHTVPLFFISIILLIYFPPCSQDGQRRQWHPTPVLLPGKSHGRRSLVSCSPWGRKESDRAERHHFHFSLSCIGEGNGNPLQCSCLENPRDGGAWRAAVYGVAQNWTWLKRLSSSSSQDGRAEGGALIFSCENTKISTSCWITIDRRMSDPTKKRYLHPRAKENPKKTAGGAQSHLESNLIPSKDAWGVQTKPCVHQDPGNKAVTSTRDWVIPAFEDLNVSCRGMGQQWPAVETGALAAVDLGALACWCKSFWRKSPLPPLPPLP